MLYRWPQLGFHAPFYVRKVLFTEYYTEQTSLKLVAFAAPTCFILKSSRQNMNFNLARLACLLIRYNLLG